MSDRRQKNQLTHSDSVVRNQQMVLAFLDESRSEAPRVSEEGTESLAGKRGTESPAIGEVAADSSTRRTAGCGPACPVVWQGWAGNCSPYADCMRPPPKEKMEGELCFSSFPVGSEQDVSVAPSL